MADEVSRPSLSRASLRCLHKRKKPPRNRLGCPSTERHPTSQFSTIFFLYILPDEPLRCHDNSFYKIGSKLFAKITIRLNLLHRGL